MFTYCEKKSIHQVSVRSVVMTEGHNTRYYKYINETVENIAKRNIEFDQFEKCITGLQAVVPTYGLSLVEFNKLLDIAIDSKNPSLKNGQKLKITSILICRDFIDFETVLKIISTFRVPSYYNKSFKTVSKHIQIKLSNILLKNFANIKLEKSFLRILNLLFNLLSIEYIRLNLSLFLIYLLNMSNSLDDKFNLVFFYNFKKFKILLNFYKTDKKNTVPMILNFIGFLYSIEKNTNFNLIFTELQLILSEIRLNRNTFGKIDIAYINSLIEMKKNKSQMNQFNEFIDNVKKYIFLTTNLNLINLNVITKKRKYLQDIQLADIVKDISIHKIYDYGSLFSNLINTKSDFILSMLQYLSTFNHDDISQLDDNLKDLKIDDLNAHYVLYYPIIKIILSVHKEKLNHYIGILLNIDYENNTFQLDSSMTWIFNSILNYIRIYPDPENRLLDCIDKIFTKSLNFKINNTTDNDDALQCLKLYDFVEFLNSPYDKYKQIINEIIVSAYKSKDADNLNGLIKLAYKWSQTSTESYNSLITDIIRHFKFENMDMLSSIFLLYSTMTLLPFKKIKYENLVVKPEILLTVIFTSDLYQYEMLFRHLQYCERYLQEYGLLENKTESMMKFKEVNDCYIESTKAYLWENKMFAKNAVSSLGICAEFSENLPYYRTDLTHNPATKGIFKRYSEEHPMETPDRPQWSSILQATPCTGLSQLLGSNSAITEQTETTDMATRDPEQ